MWFIKIEMVDGAIIFIGVQPGFSSTDSNDLIGLDTEYEASLLLGRICAKNIWGDYVRHTDQIESILLDDKSV